MNTSGTFREWIPIGDYISRYAGKFNGQNHTVSGLYYDDSGYAGLFSMMNDGTILNVGVVDHPFLEPFAPGTMERLKIAIIPEEFMEKRIAAE